MSERYSAPEIIALKRDRHQLNDDQIDWVVDAYTRGVVADEQMSQVGPRILRVRLAGAVRIQGRGIVGVARVLDVHLALAGEELAVAGVGAGQRHQHRDFDFGRRLRSGGTGGGEDGGTG